MAWTVSYDSGTQIVEVVCTGTVSTTDLHEAVLRRVRLQREHNTTLVLLDALEIGTLTAGILGVHSLPADFYEQVNADRLTRLALVRPHREGPRRITRHYEDACVNRGWSVKAFDTRGGAIDWLREAVVTREPVAATC